MAFVVAEPCVKCKYTDCVAVCPVECFYEADNFLVINPDECIDCGACEPECPVEAIFDADSLPGHWAHFKEINERLAPKLPKISEQKDPLPDAAVWGKLGAGGWKSIGQKAKEMLHKEKSR